MALRPWLEQFAHETITIKGRVSREVELTKHLVAHPNVPVHFTDLDGFEAAANVWSTRDRIAAALEIPRDELLRRLPEAQPHPKDTSVVDHAPFQQNASDDVALLDSPVPKLYPGDAGRFITAGVWVAERDGVRNLSFHRIQILDGRRGACGIASALPHATRGRPVDMVRLRNGLTVPADAEYVLEGRLTKETHAEGPFADAVRTYDRGRQGPRLAVGPI